MKSISYSGNQALRVSGNQEMRTKSISCSGNQVIRTTSISLLVYRLIWDQVKTLYTGLDLLEKDLSGFLSL